MRLLSRNEAQQASDRQKRKALEELRKIEEEVSVAKQDLAFLKEEHDRMVDKISELRYAWKSEYADFQEKMKQQSLNCELLTKDL